MLVFLFRILSFLPLRALHALGAALGWIVYLASPSHRRRLRENLERAGYSGDLRAAKTAIENRRHQKKRA
jgi:KDO2-lipid IV(A) lauroyltransferase